jgi:56kDa selenium binding protein (SBP56)
VFSASSHEPPSPVFGSAVTFEPTTGRPACLPNVSPIRSCSSLCPLPSPAPTRSYDDKYLYLTNWFGNTVQQFDVSDPFRPLLKSTVAVPHANMRLSKDNKRLYVSNSLLTTWDNDPGFGPPRNQEYGTWLFQVNRRTGGLTPSAPESTSYSFRYLTSSMK